MARRRSPRTAPSRRAASGGSTTCSGRSARPPSRSRTAAAACPRPATRAPPPTGRRNLGRRRVLEHGRLEGGARGLERALVGRPQPHPLAVAPREPRRAAARWRRPGARRAVDDCGALTSLSDVAPTEAAEAKERVSASGMGARRNFGGSVGYAAAVGRCERSSRSLGGPRGADGGDAGSAGGALAIGRRTSRLAQLELTTDSDLAWFSSPAPRRRAVESRTAPARQRWRRRCRRRWRSTPRCRRAARRCGTCTPTAYCRSSASWR